eukprot:1815779-Amphidinium_carterae.2
MASSAMPWCSITCESTAQTSSFFSWNLVFLILSFRQSHRSGSTGDLFTLLTSAETLSQSLSVLLDLRSRRSGSKSTGSRSCILFLHRACSLVARAASATSMSRLKPPEPFH